MGFRLSHGDDMNFAFCFRVTDRYNGCTQKAGGVEALLAVVIADVFLRDRWPVEHLLNIGEIKAVLFQVGRALGGFPREVYKSYYMYEYIYCKRFGNPGADERLT
jgi:hypothetical protein